MGITKDIPFDIQLKFGNLEDLIIVANFNKNLHDCDLIRYKRIKLKIKVRLNSNEFIFNSLVIACIEIINIANIVTTCIDIFGKIMHIGTIFSKESHHMNIKHCPNMY